MQMGSHTCTNFRSDNLQVKESKKATSSPSDFNITNVSFVRRIPSSGSKYLEKLSERNGRYRASQFSPGQE